ncbi:unnamed protein product [Rhizophagus irregularis]|nr:unnamed protein product [Rhizophagus irregularis]
MFGIVDGKEPKNVNAKTILICSSRREHYKHLMSIVGQLQYAICQHGVGKRSKVVGKANDVTHQAKLNEAIKGSKGDIFDDIGESCIERSKFSHMIVHINVNHPVENDNKDENGKIPYTIVTIKFASDYVKEQVTDQLEEQIRERLLEQTKQA